MSGLWLEKQKTKQNLVEIKRGHKPHSRFPLGFNIDFLNHKVQKVTITKIELAQQKKSKAN